MGTQLTPKAKKVVMKSLLAPSKIHKELQVCVSVFAMNSLFQLNTMKSTDAELKLSELFHGTGHDDNVSLVEKLLTPCKEFKHFYDYNDDGYHTLKQSFTQADTAAAPVVMGVSFTESSLSRATMSSVLILSARTIKRSAMSGMSTMKKCMAYEQEYLDSKGDFPSGTNESDLDNYVLRKMYHEISSITCDLDL